MNYETLLKNIENHKVVTIAHFYNVVEDLLSPYNDNEQENWEHLYQLIEALKQADKYNGDSDDFHNLAVSLARADQYYSACDVLEIGLGIYEKSIDLLADFLAYATKCGRIEDGKIYYQKLMNTEKTAWNWRAYDFCIEYLLTISTTSENNVEQNIVDQNIIDQLVEEFKEFHKNDEKAYFAEYTVMLSRGNEEQAIKKLQEFVDSTNLRAARCTMKVAEYYFEQGQYAIASEYIKKCKIYITDTNLSVEPGYVYMLSALCGMCQLYQDEISQIDSSQLQLRVHLIYSDCKAASAVNDTRKFSRYKDLEMQRNILERLTDIAYID